MIYGQRRSCDPSVSKMIHIYEGEFHEPGDPLCPSGWTLDGEYSFYSIWRVGEPNLNEPRPHNVCRRCWAKAQRQVKKES